ncbi:MAG: ferredoxin--NADP reductase [Saprospiraceae bacterium]|nr:ferredoxin--NADP reductase [Saprospiraceae bacterium]
MADTNFYTLKVKKVEAETDKAVVLTFEVPNNLKDKFIYKHGQYLTLKFNFKGKGERRAYSLCSSPSVDEDLKIGVKRVYKGLVSNHINDNVKEGMEIDIMPPQGHFTTEIDPDQTKDYFLFCSGSGITPMLSILKTILEEEPKSQVCIYYGNKSEDSIMFKNELAQLENRYSNQFKIIHTLTQPKIRKEGGIFGLFTKKIIDWKGMKGRIDAKRIKEIILENRRGTTPIECFMCGPEGMMRTAEDCLKTMGIDDENIHVEWFLPAEGDSKEKIKDTNSKGAKATVTMNGKTIALNLLPNESILDGLLRIDEDPPYSCMSGACSTCVCKLVSGEADMERCLALSDDEVKNGFILSCSAIPTSDEIEVNYDV